MIEAWARSLSPRQFLTEVLRRWGAVEEAVRGHRARVVTDLITAEAEAKEEGGCWRLEADELSVSARASFSWSLWKQKCGAQKKSEAFVVSNLPLSWASSVECIRTSWGSVGGICRPVISGTL